jgi:hypothetical protein
MSKSKESSEDIKHNTYLEERTSLMDAKKESSQYFDKSILTLASGALGLSLTFITKIAPTPKESTVAFLYWAWIFFCASMLSTLVSFLTSQHACQKQIAILESSYFGIQGKTQDRNLLGTITVILNWSSVVLFILGIIFLVAFSVLNIKK